jgi:hypothetical protein
MNQTVKAEGLIWLIVGVFWVIAQIAGATAKKKQPPRPADDAGPDEMPVDPLTELLRKMAGGQPFETPEPVRTEPVLQKDRPAVPQTPRRRVEVGSLPDIKPLRSVVRTAEVETKTARVPEIDIRPTMAAFRNSVPTIRMPVMKPCFQTPRSFSGGETLLNPDDKNSLRRAMLSHIIFSPPKALEQSRP